MQAIVFSAGLGTRLRPLTNEIPKALVEIRQQPLLGRVISQLEQAGFNRIVVNVHHFADKVKAYLHSFPARAEIIISDESDLLLDTGGGLVKAHPLFEQSQPIFAVNVDVVTDLDYSILYETHKQALALATLAVRNRNSSRLLLFDETGNLVGWKHQEKQLYRFRPGFEGDPDNLKPMAFSGIQCFEHSLYRYCPDKEMFSMIDWYLNTPLLAGRIQAYDHSEGFWTDVGKPDDLERVRF